MFAFAGGTSGRWRVDRLEAVAGPILPPVERLDVRSAGGPVLSGAIWTLRGFTTNERYVGREQRRALSERQPPLGRPEATRAALIPIRKSPGWWQLAQDERREIFEDRSRHVDLGLDHLPAIARRLHHGRDLGEPFDFLTWFEYAPHDAEDFEALVGQLRATEEWRYVEREVDIRLSAV